MFFQVMLLAGYAYAHAVGRAVRPSRQFWLHGAIVVAGFIFLPFGIDRSWSASSGSSPILWLIGMLTASVGWPFFALSASAPLLQSWFGRSGHRMSSDPYFLYSASNLGSLLALLAFPFLLEPSWTLAEQSRIWTATYALLPILIGACALAARWLAPGTRPSTDRAAPPQMTVAWQQRMVWVALAFVPSSLLLGVTSHITTDVASAPLLWVVPLALYLLSFVIAFSRRPLLKPEWTLKAQVIGLLTVAVLAMLNLMFSLSGSVALVGMIHLSTFFLTALVCHTELARRRPGVDGITTFYFCMSIGGAAGGIFNALIAPVIFSSAYEYYLMLVAACALRRFATRTAAPFVARDFIFPALLAAAIIAVSFYSVDNAPPSLLSRALVLIPCGLALYSFSERPFRFALGVAGVLGSVVFVQGSVGVLHQERSFFGVNRVKIVDHGTKMALIHGTTMHGTEFVDSPMRREPLAYYSRLGPVGQVFAARQAPHAVAVIGLGAGALACYRRPGESWTFYEIDGVVEHIARDTRYFHYLEDCGDDTRIVLGDGRLSLKQASDHVYDMIIVDAFSSDAVPIHLLTTEALSLYLQKLTDHGVILFNVSNLHLRLAPAVAALAEGVGVAGRHQLFLPSVDDIAHGASGSDWIVIARHQQDLAFLDEDTRWEALAAAPGAKPWSDDFSNIVSAIKW
ncbi:MAG TPA: fused MFS/spermidine synthase [Stellaceae bacterium]|nr:fused MFS/spermidine synthase [Stellaceae bacterium]